MKLHEFMARAAILRNPFSRRTWLQAASGVWLGSLANASIAPVNANAPPGFGRAKSVIFVVANGGQSQIDIWDPKPRAPLEIRGEFQAIPTAVPGTLLGEHLPRLATIADRYALVRTMSHEDLDHGSAVYLTLTGQYHPRRSSNPLPAETDWPAHAAVIKRLRPGRKFIDSAVHVNGPAVVPTQPSPGQNGGFLGPDFSPLLLGDVTAEPVVMPGLAALPEVALDRREVRRRLLHQLEEQLRPGPQGRAAYEYRVLTERSYELLSKPEVQHAFELEQESPALRRRYGLDRSGQACLLARRLVEAGVTWITVFWNHSGRGQDKSPDDTLEYGWDTHNDLFYALREHLLPRFDQSFSALIEDLSDRGLLDDTLVVCAGEFGRAPLVALEPRFAGASPGRKHWAACYSVVCAGAGVRGGLVVGESDSRGAYPVTEKYGPWDLTATMFASLGIDPQGHFTDRAGRQSALTSGRPIAALY
jgi:hypothetical protein